MMLVLLASIALSTGLLLILCLGDPKRRRNLRMADGAQHPTMRRVLTAFSLLPGIPYLAAGNVAAFLLWLGGYAVAGWLVTLGVFQIQRGSRERL